MNTIAAAVQMIEEIGHHTWDWRLVQNPADYQNLVVPAELQTTDAAIISGGQAYTLYGPRLCGDEQAVLPLFNQYQAWPMTVTLREDAFVIAGLLQHLHRQHPRRHSCLWELEGTLEISFDHPEALQLLRPIHLSHFVGQEGWSRIFAAAEQPITGPIKRAFAMA